MTGTRNISAVAFLASVIGLSGCRREYSPDRESYEDLHGGISASTDTGSSDAIGLRTLGHVVILSEGKTGFESMSEPLQAVEYPDTEVTTAIRSAIQDYRNAIAPQVKEKEEEELEKTRERVRVSVNRAKETFPTSVRHQVKRELQRTNGNITGDIEIVVAVIPFELTSIKEHKEAATPILQELVDYIKSKPIGLEARIKWPHVDRLGGDGEIVGFNPGAVKAKIPAGLVKKYLSE